MAGPNKFFECDFDGVKIEATSVDKGEVRLVIDDAAEAYISARAAAMLGLALLELSDVEDE